MNRELIPVRIPHGRHVASGHFQRGRWPYVSTEIFNLASCSIDICCKSPATTSTSRMKWQSPLETRCEFANYLVELFAPLE